MRKRYSVDKSLSHSYLQVNTHARTHTHTTRDTTLKYHQKVNTSLEAIWPLKPEAESNVVSCELNIN